MPETVPLHEELRALVADEVARAIRRVGAFERALAIRRAPDVAAIGIEDDARVCVEHAAVRRCRRH